MPEPTAPLLSSPPTRAIVPHYHGTPRYLRQCATPHEVGFPHVRITPKPCLNLLAATPSLRGTRGTSITPIHNSRAVTGIPSCQHGFPPLLHSGRPHPSWCSHPRLSGDLTTLTQPNTLPHLPTASHNMAPLFSFPRLQPYPRIYNSPPAGLRKSVEMITVQRRRVDSRQSSLYLTTSSYCHFRMYRHWFYILFVVHRFDECHVFRILHI